MQAHPLPFAHGQGARLVPDAVRDRASAEVVQETGPAQRHYFLPTRRRGKLRDLAGVAGREGRLEVYEVGEHLQHRVQPGLRDPGPGFRLAAEHFIPGRGCFGVGDEVRLTEEGIGHLRVVGLATSHPDHLARLLAATQPVQHLQVSRQEDDPGRQRDLLSGDSVG